MSNIYLDTETTSIGILVSYTISICKTSNMAIVILILIVKY